MQMIPIQTQPVLETAQFDLRPVQATDAGLIAQHLSDTRVAMQAPDLPHPLRPDTVTAFIADALASPRDKHVWVMDTTKSGGTEVAGVVALTHLGREQSEICFWVSPAFWQSPIALDAVTALTTANPLDHSACFATVFQDNSASAGVLTRAGFVYLGDAETYCPAREAAVPTWTYTAKLRD